MVIDQYSVDAWRLRLCKLLALQPEESEDLMKTRTDTQYDMRSDGDERQ